MSRFIKKVMARKKRVITIAGGRSRGRSRRQEREAGAGGRSGRQEQEAGAGGRGRRQEQAAGAGGRSRRPS
jgi:hypothetical protein